jgi:DNA-binding FadR family transcriptional regulator
LKRASLLVHRIVEEILAEGWRPGDFIGAVQELSVRYGVSPPIIREAVRLLDHMQVGEVRRGSAGGLFVRQPSTAAAAVLLRRYFAYSRVHPTELDLARRHLLRATVALAVERMTESEIRALRDVGDALDRDPYVVVHELASVARNPGLAACLDAVLPGGLETRRALARSTPWVAVNREFAEAARLGDGARAAGVVDELLAVEREVVGCRQFDGVLDDSNERSSLSERVALALVREIDARALQPGDLVGTEESLTHQLRVSRAALRESLRILEYHSVATMRPGPGGGLVVGRPDPDSVVEVVSIQLDLLSIGPRQIHELRRAVELPAFEATARELTADVATELKSLVGVLGTITPDEVNDVGYRLFLAVADASGNRPLATFVRIATRLQSERVEQFAQGPDEKLERTHQLAAVQRRILEAVLDGDPAVARHRLLRHLEEVQRYVTPVPALPQHRRSALSATSDEDVVGLE